MANSKTTKTPKSGFGPSPQIGMASEKAKNFKGAFKKLIQYVGKYKVGIIIVFIFAICSTVFGILGPKILGMATTELFEGIMRKIEGDANGVDFAAISKILIFLLILYVISTLFSLVQGLIMSKVSTNITYTLRNDIEAKIHRLPLSFYDKTSTGDVLSRITNDVDAINQSLSQGITQIITSVATLVGIIVMMLTISWQMTLIALATLPLSLGLIGLVVKKSQKHFTRQQEFLGAVNGQVEENYGAHIVVKAFNGEEKSQNEFDENNEALYKSAWKANFLSSLMMPILTFIGNLGYVAICIIGGYLVSGGSIRVGDIQAFIQYMRQFSQPITQVSQISTSLQQTAAAAERVFEFLEEEEELTDKDDALLLCLPRERNALLNSVDSEDLEKALADKGIQISGSVDFKNVKFGYTEDTLIINDFNAQIKPGQKVAIVGPTGAGKTTIVKLLMRFYDINSGSISLDHHNINDFKREELRSAFGMVLQDTWLYNTSIMENIRYGRLGATDEEVISAAKAAQVHHFVSTLPKGYGMELNEEASNVSQGQKQLLTIARAILADPKILILDEATSSVDTRTEILIQKAMDNLMHGRTSFIIAHRLSTIKNADIILVMKDGDIIEQGNHHDLLKQDGFYANLYNSQFQH